MRKRTVNVILSKVRSPVPYRKNRLYICRTDSNVTSWSSQTSANRIWNQTIYMTVARLGPTPTTLSVPNYSEYNFEIATRVQSFVKPIAVRCAHAFIITNTVQCYIRFSNYGKFTVSIYLPQVTLSALLSCIIFT